MRKSAIIAKCLVNSNMMTRLEDAECAVEKIFIGKFPNSNFSKWNQEINDKIAEHIIRTVGRASRINVNRFIKDLW